MTVCKMCWFSRRGDTWLYVCASIFLYRQREILKWKKQCQYCRKKKWTVAGFIQIIL